MIGPSSSHTAGAVRIGMYANSILGEKPILATVNFSGSFAKTYKGHGTDIAVVAGILGMDTDNDNIPQSLTIAEDSGLYVQFFKVDISDSHPNTMEIILKGASGKEISVEGSSIGGGNIIINKINNVPVTLNGKSDALIIPHKDMPGMIAMVSNILGACTINIHGFSLFHDRYRGTAVMTIEIEGDFDDAIKNIILRNEFIFDVTYLKAI